jgi:hypothetical protein
MRNALLATVLVGILALGAAQLFAVGQPSAAPDGARTVVVPANVEWTTTTLSVRRGQWLRFEPSGEIRLSFHEGDTATAAGAKNLRLGGKAPIPAIPAGTLIGRVGNRPPFSIGNTTQALQMPADGRLFLGVNDDHVPDNSGNYVVKVWEPEGRGQRAEGR